MVKVLDFGLASRWPPSPFGDPWRSIDRMRDDGVVADYAIGGATAVLFYAEPTRTYDLAVFVTLHGEHGGELVSLSSVYEWARGHGIRTEAEHLMIEGVPVQLLPAYNELVKASLSTARVHDYEGVAVRVVGPEHLLERYEQPTNQVSHVCVVPG